MGLCVVLVLSGCVSRQTTIAPYRATSRPYKIKGRWYYPQPYYELKQTGIASYYGRGHGAHGLPTATGERFCRYRMSAAHKTLPLPCMVRVTNLENGRQVVLRINDRGPFIRGRILDVSAAAARQLGFYHQGLARVHMETLVAESLALPENRPGARLNMASHYRPKRCRKPRRHSCLSHTKTKSKSKKTVNHHVSKRRVTTPKHRRRRLPLRRTGQAPYRSIEDLLAF
jgi:rare lipoprotein A